MSQAKAAAGRPDLSLRRCLGHFATGVAIVTYDTPEGPRGLTVNSLTSVSLDPPLVLVCVGKGSKAAERLPGTAFAVNVLHADQRDLAWHFAGRPSETIRPEWHGEAGAPRLADSLAWLACEPWSVHDAGDHLIVLGSVQAFGAGFGAGMDEPLCFFRGEFLQLPVRPSSPSA